MWESWEAEKWKVFNSLPALDACSNRVQQNSDCSSSLPSLTNDLILKIYFLSHKFNFFLSRAEGKCFEEIWALTSS